MGSSDSDDRGNGTGKRQSSDSERGSGSGTGSGETSRATKRVTDEDNRTGSSDHSDEPTRRRAIKRTIDETLLSKEEARKLEQRRAYNRKCAANARQRTKDLVTSLQQEVDQLKQDKNELQRANDVMKAQLDLLEGQNRNLLLRQGGAAGGAVPDAQASGLNLALPPNLLQALFQQQQPQQQQQSFQQQGSLPAQLQMPGFPAFQQQQITSPVAAPIPVASSATQPSVWDQLMALGLSQQVTQQQHQQQNPVQQLVTQQQQGQPLTSPQQQEPPQHIQFPFQPQQFQQQQQQMMAPHQQQQSQQQQNRNEQQDQYQGSEYGELSS